MENSIAIGTRDIKSCGNEVEQEGGVWEHQIIFSFLKSYSDSTLNHLSLRNVLVGIGETLDVLLNQTVATQELNVGAVLLEFALLAKLDVFLAADGGEAPVLGDDDLLAAGELVHGAAESLDGGGTVGVTGADGHKDLADVHTGDETLRLTEGTTHTGLETIRSGARKHLVDTDDVEGVHTDAQVETFLTGDLHKVPVETRIRSWFERGHGRGRIVTYLLAQIRAASRASEDSCSYSLETRWTQVGKSSTLAFLRPRSKIRILGSGTPRLNRDLG